MYAKLVFIVWCRHSRRAETLAAELGGRVSFQYEEGLKSPWLVPLRYLVQSWQTWRLLNRERPEVILVQSPPIFAPLIVAAWCRLQEKTRHVRHRTVYAIDCHTGTFYGWWRWALPLLRFLSRRAAVTLVASEDALEILRSWKVKCMFLLDGLPVLSLATGTIGSEGEARVAVICSYGPEEPIAEVFAAARLLPGITFYFSGDPKRRRNELLASKPENVIMTGFLSDNAYAGLLKNVHGIVDLTTWPQILTCGVYEALAMGKPAVISNWPQIKRNFNRGFILVDNTPESIAAGVEQMLHEHARLSTEIITMRSELVARRQPEFEELTALLQP